MDVRAATVDDTPLVRNVLDAGLLELDSSTLEEAIEREAVLLAVSEREETVLGVLVLDGDEILAIAVRKRRQGQGIGTVLVEAAVARRGSLSAEFHERVRPFWESLGFSIEERDEENRYRGELPTVTGE